ncbi:MAG: polymerase sigma factor RpoE [Polyangiaceae bacterium]|nr:polymerase sigma factor RpoE [Polyangiaceae bacterium]
MQPRRVSDHGEEGATRPPETSAASAAAFERIYDEWYAHVARWVRALGVRSADVEDLVQDVFIIVHRRLATFDGQNLGGWLYRITRRRVRDYRQLVWVRSFFGVQSLAPSEELLQTAVGPLEELERIEGQRLLERLLAALTPDQRVAFVLFEIEGQKGEEIARLQQVAVNTVWARVHKARKTLLRELARRAKR